MDKKPTPIQTARNWAAQNPTADGTITVAYNVPKGRGGRRGIAHCHATFFVSGGKAARTTTRRRQSLAGYTAWHFNGRCYRCDELHLAPELTYYYIPNPHAGQPAKLTFTNNAVYGPYASISLCPACCNGSTILTENQFRAVTTAYDEQDRYIEVEHLTRSRQIADNTPLAILSLEEA